MSKKRPVRATEFEVEDSKGRVRARFGVSGDDSPFLAFFGIDEKLRARFGVQDDGSAGLAIADEEGKVRATFGLFSDGSASMAMVDKNGKVRAKFGLGTEGSPTLALHSRSRPPTSTAIRAASSRSSASPAPTARPL